MADAPLNRLRWMALGGLGGRTLLYVALILVAIAAADRVDLRWDLSADHRFQLDPALRALLAAQSTPTGLVGIWGSDDEAVADALIVPLRQMAAVSPRLSYQHIDPDLNRPALQDFATRHHGVATRGLYLVRADQLYAIPLSYSTRLTLQRDIGAGLNVLNDPHPPLAVIVQGHGELRPDGGASDGCDALMHALALGGMRVSTFQADGAGHAPADSLLILAGPRHDLGAPGIDLVRTHLRDGGAVLACVDDQAPGDLCGYLRTRGVLCGGGYPRALAHNDLSGLLDASVATEPAAVVYSWSHNFSGDSHAFPYPNLLLGNADAPTPMINPQHPATAGVAAAAVPVLSPETTQVEALSPAYVHSVAPAVAERWGASGLAPQTTTKLLSTEADDAWRQIFGPDLHQPEGWEHAQPLGLAWAVEYPADAQSVQDGQGGRLIVWGSRQALSDGVLSQPLFANGDVLRSMAAWLVHRAPLTTIPDTPLIAYHARLGERGMAWFIGVMVVVLPIVLLGGAMLTWIDRR